MDARLRQNRYEKALNQEIARKYFFRKWFNLMMLLILFLASLLALIPLASTFWFVLSKGFHSINLDFFTKLPKPVGETGGGMANALLGTAQLVLLASLIGVPWGVSTGIYLAEFGQRGFFAKAIRFATELLSSVPSIIIGLFVYAIVVVPMKHFSALAGGLALGIIMIPTVARNTEEILKTVPVHIREAGLGLGLPRWKVILRIVFMGSLKPIMTGIMLSIARAAGETAPLLFTSFNNKFWGQGILQPISSLPVQIYTYSISPYDDWHDQAMTASLVLILFVFSLNIVAKIVMGSRGGGK